MTAARLRRLASMSRRQSGAPLARQPARVGSRPMRPTPLILTLCAAAALSACAKRTEPPGTAGVCYHVVPQKDGSMKYNKLVNTPDLEHCAANLEAMRVKFLMM